MLYYESTERLSEVLISPTNGIKADDMIQKGLIRLGKYTSKRGRSKLCGVKHEVDPKEAQEKNCLLDQASIRGDPKGRQVVQSQCTRWILRERSKG